MSLGQVIIWGNGKGIFTDTQTDRDFGLREKKKKKYHDIYILGVYLVKMTLWHSFISYVLDTRGPHPCSELNIDSAIMDRNPQQGGIRTKGELVAISKGRLDRVIGEPYTEIVLACLGCLDQDKGRNVFEKTHGGLKDEDGIVVGVRYIENVSTIVVSGLWWISLEYLPVVTDTTQDRRAINLDLQTIREMSTKPAKRVPQDCPAEITHSHVLVQALISVHTTIGCGEQGFPSAQPYLNHTPAG